MRFALFASVLFHVAVVSALLVFQFDWWRRDFAPEQYIPLELIKDADLDLKTSIPAARPEPKKEEIKPDLPEPEEEEKIAPPVEEVKPPAPKEPEPIAKEPEPKKPELVPEKKPDGPKPKPKPKPDELDFDSLSKLIDKEKEKEQAQRTNAPSETAEVAERERAAVGAGDRLTASDEAKLKAAMARCWNASAIIGAPEPEKLVVVIDFELNRNGSLASPPRVVNDMQINLSGNQFWQVAKREALTAINKCAPYDFLPPERYESWKEFRFNFDPSQMVGF